MKNTVGDTYIIKCGVLLPSFSLAEAVVNQEVIEGSVTLVVRSSRVFENNLETAADVDGECSLSPSGSRHLGADAGPPDSWRSFARRLSRDGEGTHLGRGVSVHGVPERHARRSVACDHRCSDSESISTIGGERRFRVNVSAVS